MPNDDEQRTEEEKALDEQIRQAELLIGAQATFLAAAYHRATVLAGLVFVVAAALLSLTDTDLVSPLVIYFARKMGLFALAPLVLLGFATALTHADLPGAIHSRKRQFTERQLKHDLLEQYREAAKWNKVRLAVSRYVIASVALTIFAIGSYIYIEVQDVRAFQRALVQPELAARAWDDQSNGVRRAFKTAFPDQTEEEWETMWNRLTPDQRRAYLIQVAEQVFEDFPNGNESVADTPPE
jgi:hypothetical protein